MTLLDALHLLGASQIFLLALFVFLRRRRRDERLPGQDALLSLLVAAGVTILIGWLFASRTVLAYPAFSRTGFIGGMLTAVFMVILVRQQRDGSGWNRIDAALLLPPGLLLLGLLPFWTGSFTKQAAYVRADLNQGYQWPTLLYYYLSHGYNLALLSGALLLLWRSPGSLPAPYLLRLKLYVGVYGAVQGLVLLARFTGVFYASGLGSTIGSVLGIALGLDWLFAQAGGSRNYMEVTPPRKATDQDQRVAKSIRAHLEREQPYLNPDYRLADLAGELELPAAAVTRAIAVSSSGRNFNDLLNHYRVREVERRLASDAYREHTLLRIALDCGFNSKSSFNRIFREITGRSPREFRRSPST